MGEVNFPNLIARCEQYPWVGEKDTKGPNGRPSNSTQLKGGGPMVVMKRPLSLNVEHLFGNNPKMRNPVNLMALHVKVKAFGALT